jgi:tRNA pseudouridine38-40 synthase
MLRYALGVEYIGTSYKGWQKQKKTNLTIQEKIEESLSKVANENVKSICSGRTDSGVHASMQVIHFETSARRLNKAWLAGCNSILPRDISINWIKKVPIDFHSRFSAIKRTYRYHIFNGNKQSVFNRDFTSLVIAPLDINLMQKASKFFIGEKDFSSFRGSGCQSKSPNRNIFDIKIKKRQKIVSIEISANAFLLNMVRIIVGTLIEVGLKKIKPEAMKDILEVRDRTQAGKTAEAKGLFYIGPEYNSSFKIYKPKYKNHLTLKS